MPWLSQPGHVRRVEAEQRGAAAPRRPSRSCWRRCPCGGGCSNRAGRRGAASTGRPRARRAQLPRRGRARVHQRSRSGSRRARSAFIGKSVAAGSACRDSRPSRSSVGSARPNTKTPQRSYDRWGDEVAVPPNFAAPPRGVRLVEPDSRLRPALGGRPSEPTAAARSAGSVGGSGVIFGARRGAGLTPSPARSVRCARATRPRHSLAAAP